MPCVNLRKLRVFRHLTDWVLQKDAPQTSSSLGNIPLSSTGEIAPATDYIIRGNHLYIKHLRPAFVRSANVSDSNLSQLVAQKLGQLSTIQTSRSKFRAMLHSRSDIINAESCLGGTIFGPIPEGHRREFFHDDKNIWIWHESWTDQYNQDRQVTVRYEIRPTGVYKKYASGEYLRLVGPELLNFRKATHAYLKVIKEGIYDTELSTV